MDETYEQWSRRRRAELRAAGVAEFWVSQKTRPAAWRAEKAEAGLTPHVNYLDIDPTSPRIGTQAHQMLEKLRAAGIEVYGIDGADDHQSSLHVDNFSKWWTDEMVDGALRRAVERQRTPTLQDYAQRDVEQTERLFLNLTTEETVDVEDINTQEVNEGLKQAVEDARKQMVADEIAARRKIMDGWGPNPAGGVNGTVITFIKQFRKDGPSYHYAAIYANGFWYTSGPTGGKMDWDALKLWLVSGYKAVRHIYIQTAQVELKDGWREAGGLAMIDAPKAELVPFGQLSPEDAEATREYMRDLDDRSKQLLEQEGLIKPEDDQYMRRRVQETIEAYDKDGRAPFDTQALRAKAVDDGSRTHEALGRPGSVVINGPGGKEIQT